MQPGDNPIVIPSPPVIDTDRSGRWMTALPALGGLGSIGFLAMAPRSPFIYVAGGLFLITTIAMAVASMMRARRQGADSRGCARRRYVETLHETRAALELDAKALRRKESSAAVRGSQLVLPLLACTLPRATEVVLTCDEDADPFCRELATRLTNRHSAVRGVRRQVTVDADLRLHGDAGAVREVQRQIAGSVIESVDYADIRIAVLTDSVDRWRPLRWAPHHRHPTRRDESGPLRLVSTTAPHLRALLADVSQPVLLIVDHPTSPAGVGETWCVRRTTDRDAATVVLSPDELSVEGSPIRGGEPLTCGPAALERIARACAARSTAAPDAVRVAGPARSELLRPIIGSTNAGHLVLDLREAGDGGDGPHGMLIGATGSGKSELLRLLVCELIDGHPPTELTFAFIDFKGGATFAPFDAIPHLAASITNLADDPGLVERARQALSAELRRRQRVLSEHGVASISELAKGALARLVVIVDEFSELLVQEPEMIDVLAQIGRLGRSLGVHLLIASQRLDEGRLKGLDSHLSYRIALRTQSAAESRSVIGTGDAAALPSEPGYGYLAAGGVVTRFVARYAGAPALQPVPQTAEVAVPMHYANGPEVALPREAAGPSILAAAVARAMSHEMMAAPIWIAPPTHSPSIRDLYADLQVRAVRGFGSVRGARLSIPIGWVDRPDRQAIEVCELDLSGGGGHVGIVGATRSGASSAAAALLLSIAVRNTPEEAVLYALDLGGGLPDITALPHLAASATSCDAERARAIVSRLLRLVREREPAQSGGPDVFVLIDGMARFREDYEDLEPAVLQIARRGLRVGVHLICTAHRWLELRAPLRDLLGTRIELRLGDPVESEIDRRAAARVPRSAPGRGLTPDGRPLYIAHEDARARRERSVIDDIAAAWQGPRARGFRELPAVLTAAHLSPQVRAHGVCIAVDRESRRAISLDESNRFTFVVGDPASGRTSVLRSLGRQDAEHGSRLVVLDPRRTMLDDLPTNAVIGHAPTPAAAHEALAGLVSGLERRMPRAELSGDELRAGSWWSGPQLHLLVDDYDLLTLGGGSLGVLRRFLPYAGDIGLRVTVARRASGAARALHDDALSAMRELGMVALVLSTTVDEGPILGVRPARLPWSRGVLSAGGRPPVDVQAVVERSRRPR